MASYCPICDQPITGKFCRGCGRFVRPVERADKIIINAGHDPEKDTDCDYHGTTEDFHSEYHSDAENYSYHENDNPYIHQGDYSGSYNTNYNAGQPYNPESTKTDEIKFKNSYAYNYSYGRYEKRKAGNLGVFVGVLIVVACLIAIISVVNNDMAGDYYSNEYEFDDDNFDDYWDALDDDEYENLCEKLGYDSKGYKSYDTHEDAVNSGLEDINVTFDVDYHEAAERMAEKLNELGIETDEPVVGEYDEYSYLSIYGEEIANFKIYDTYNLPGVIMHGGINGYFYVEGESTTEKLCMATAHVYDIDQVDAVVSAMAYGVNDRMLEDYDFDELDDDILESSGYWCIDILDYHAYITVSFNVDDDGNYNGEGFFIFVNASGD